MNFQIVQPSGFLSNYIQRYCFMESDKHEKTIVERVIPVEHIQLMFHYRNPFTEYHPDESIVKQSRSILSGLTDSFSDVSTNGETGVVFVSFYPAGACHFFRFPLSEIENRSIDLSDIFGQQVRQVEERLYLSRSIKEKVSVIEHFLAGLYSPVPLYDSLLIGKGVDLIKHNNGQNNAALLCDQLSVTPKTLERKFSRYLGKTTKQVIKLFRFYGVLHDFTNDKCTSMTERAYRNGYSDQSHFIRDFKSFSGYTPGEFTSKYPEFNIDNDYC
ncbi:MAG: helix-turn-helix domain-containing protein [Bacteroidota bacterium]|nr:helix-turn-helix domain-containing protein [Bacteroidota bacterium]